mmetsp:Transcript_75010/g.119270  ORF Transcript_75010/g.119270 Transcript_75010/m.119270 type:complete len:245 (+) Transcript_75010:25-759(+)
MIECLQFTKTSTVEETINHALQSHPSNASKKKLEQIQQSPSISLEDAQFIVNLLNEHHSHDHKHYVHDLLHGCDVYKPPPKISKNPQFEEYLKTLRAKQERRAYDKLINANKPTPHQKSLFSTIRDERGVQQWLEVTNIGHLLMVMVGSFLIFFYLAHHLYPHQKEYRLVGGAVGLLLGLAVEYALMVVREEKAELEEKAKTHTLNKKSSHLQWNEKSIQSVLDAQKERNAVQSEQDSKDKKTK